ncbi:Multidrug export protein MepA [Tritonibacter multivorans]|uniref:Multidrug export protein MepA n=1 Tax=Tritonibacter multivorans TaxID=928856 RepID=A0A0N7LZF0_9RHOB|nr:MATE family efflux transporter [Tritonibacter multivorans]MDA7421220.1 MATE family efflux transporter [Tritonibacter multivorans]CUH77481.1 Multidrug export protein MepA [Tritonibacter multivorans]SFD32767.1 putative efflux protein, MATE family [Tritonibacter multivorans]
MAEQAKFLSGNLFRHITVMSFTASLGLMAVFAVDFVDMIFISMLGKDELAAAVGYAAAILFFTTSFNIGVAIAAGALVARALGAGNAAQAQARASHALLAGGLACAGFVVLIWLSLETLVSLVGASGRPHDLAVHYLQIIVPSLPFLLIGMAGGAILRAHGDARRAMMATIAGGLVNAVLDPILIFGLDLELTGAALASVAARIAMAYFALAPIFRHHGGLRWPRPLAFLRDLPPIAAIALPAILTQLATPVGQAYVTRAMAEFGEEAVAGMAIVGRMTPLAFATIFALSGAIGPIVGQNFGAGQLPRVRQTLRDSLIFTGLFVVAMALLLFLLRDHVIALFNATGDAQTLIYLFCGPLALMFFFNGALFVANACFNNLGRPFYSTWLNWGRHTVGTIPFVWVGAQLWGAPGALVGQALGGLIFGLLAVWLALRLIDQTETTPVVATPGLFQRQARQVVLFFNRR